MEEFYGADLDRPLVIVGNGPSSAFVAHELLPDDPVVFRMNWFFLEDRYRFGRTVDGFFYAIPNLGLEDRLAEIVKSGVYDVRALSSPMRIPTGRDDEPHASSLYEVGLPELDHWSLIARNPVLSRFMMSRPLPTQGVQVLAAALELGFRDITLCGIDMYESSDARYGFAIPDDVAAALDVKDLTPGYESAHSLDRDLDFLDACLLQYPEANIRHVGPSRHLAARLPAPEPRGRPCTFAGSPAPEVLSESKPRYRIGRAATDANAQVELSDTEPLPHATIDGKRCAYVTYVSGPFHHGARALARSVAKVSDVPLIVMCAPSADRPRLEQSGLVCIDVPDIYNPNALAANRVRFAATYGKLNAFGLSQFDRAVYLDGDMVVLKQLDDLFERSGFWAAPDHGIEHVHDSFNSGLFGFDPDAAMLADMIDQVRTMKSYDQGDQGFLNAYFPEWQRLPHEYNVNKRWAVHHPNLFHLDTTRVIHFTGVKPWQPEPQNRFDELYRLWFSFLSQEELIEVAEALRHVEHGERTRRSESGSWFGRLLRRVRRSAPSRGGGSPVGRFDAARSAGQHSIALSELLESWPGDDRASAAMWRRRGIAEILVGDIDAGTKTLSDAAVRFPSDEIVRASLVKADRLVTVRRVSLGMVPDTVLARVARLVSQ